MRRVANNSLWRSILMAAIKVQFPRHQRIQERDGYRLLKKYFALSTIMNGKTNKINIKTCFNYQLNAQFLYSITLYMLHYNPRHVSSSTMLIFRRSNCIITASGIVTLCKRPYSTPIESRLCRVFSHPAYCTSVYRE